MSFQLFMKFMKGKPESELQEISRHVTDIISAERQLHRLLSKEERDILLPILIHELLEAT